MYNAEEIFLMAERIEENGAIFYRLAAKRFAELPELAALLERLARMEDQHEHAFLSQRERLFGERTEYGYAEHADMAADYLKALVREKVFVLSRDPAELMAGVATAEQLLELAIGREKDAILFYVGMKDLVPADEDRAHIDLIIRQEMSHVTLLEDELRRHSSAAPAR